MKVDREKQFTDAYLVHVAGNRLEAILKRLRAEQKEDPDGALHKKHISFTPSVQERIELTGRSLKGALERHIGKELPIYIERKQTALRRLGFGPAPFQVVTTFDGVSESDLLDAFLGFRNDIPETRVQVSETRFDITISEPETVATVRFEPHSSDSCLITYRATPLAVPVSVRGDVIRAPRIGKLFKMRIRSKLVDVVLEAAGRKIDVHFTFHPHDSRCSPSEWRDYWRLLAGVFGDSGEIEFRFESARHPLTIQVKEREIPNRAQILDEAERMERVFAALSDLCTRAGVVPEPQFSGDAVIASWRAIMAFRALATGVQPELTCIGESESMLLETRPEAVIVASSFDVDAVRFAMYGVSSVSYDEAFQKPSMQEFSFRRLRVIDNDVAVFHEYVATVRELENVGCVLFI
ncbi:hypothetical protein CUJ87_30880 (plasmid) [Paraburkholderia caledonica]|nr:hypothetical protein CUJ87_30880 [Paraburkholderia caledonica]